MVPLGCALRAEREWLFIAGNRAISTICGETSGFASLPYDRFAIGPISRWSALPAGTFSPSRQNPWKLLTSFGGFGQETPATAEFDGRRTPGRLTETGKGWRRCA
jgi:hypothetical protein